MDKKLIVYGDWASQPSRAVVAFCKINKIPYEFKEIRVGLGQHRSDEYEKIAPH
jgi:glutathione S-transferase